jgi:glutamate-1-semialdehyde 2,1-aminomutase
LRAFLQRDTAYMKRTPGSRALFEKAQKVTPAGVSYRIRFFEPYPFFVKESKGAHLIDVDGNLYTDYWCTHLSMILGHRYPAVVEAIKTQAEKGWHPGLEHELEISHAEAITKHLRSVEMIRYTSSGSEAIFFAIRLARTFTKRCKIAKFEGGWHGPYDPVHVALRPPFDKPVSGGLTKGSQEDTIVVPYNDLEGFLDRVKRQEVACVILEPILTAGGSIPAERDFLKGLREYCDDAGSVLVFDEIVTGFRLGLSGAQGYFGVKPDLTVLGKIIGGGLPIGALSGEREIMEHMDHTKYSGSDFAYHGGTFAANAISLAAGLATMHVLEHCPVYEHIDRLGKKTRAGLNSIFESLRFPAQATGVGSLFSIHTTEKKPVKDARSYDLCDHEQSRKMFNYLLDNGILILTPEILHGAISYSHTEDDVKQLVSTIEEYVKNSQQELLC